MASKRVTLADVAAEAGVSPQTVSRTINQRNDVAEDTRKRVLAAIRKLDYRPNKVARSLVSQQTHTLGLVSYPLRDQFRADILTGIDRGVRKQGYLPILATTNSDPQEVVDLVHAMEERQVDGLLLVAPSAEPSPDLTVSLPTVTLGYAMHGEHVINVDVDNHLGGRLAIRHLIDLGHRHIGVVSGPPDRDFVRQRIDGATDAVTSADVGTVSLNTVHARAFALEEGYKTALRLMALYPETTAIFCHSDYMAFGAHHALRELGLVVPDDISLVGCDNLELGSYTNPPLTSVSQPGHELGRLMAQLVVNWIQGNGQVPDVVVKPSLVVRESSRPAPVKPHNMRGA